MAQGAKGNAAGWPLVIGLAALVVLAIVFVQAGQNPAANGTVTVQPTGATSGSPTNSSPTSDIGPKLTQEIQDATDQASLLLTPSPAPGTVKPTLDVTAEPVSISQWQRAAGAGTLVWNLSPVADASYALTTKWYEAKGETKITAFAGADRDPVSGQASQQGIVIVEIETSGNHTDQVIETPTAAGPVHVDDAQGERLILRTSASSGPTFYFDVPTLDASRQQIVDSCPPPHRAHNLA